MSITGVWSFEFVDATTLKVIIPRSHWEHAAEMAWKEHDLDVPLTIKGIARQVNSVYERTELFQGILRSGLGCRLH